jgi:5,6-dimethylbenzimidazole synthase
MTELVFSAAERDSFYRLVAARRDVRHFVPGSTVDETTLMRLLQAAHDGPSVGLMQPWRFIRIADAALRERLQVAVEAERQRTADALGERRDEFLRLKVEGLRDCAVLLAAVLAPDDGTVFGRRTLGPEMALASLACAIQNLWLAARVEQLGMGWVSMFEPAAVDALLGVPAGGRTMGLLCLGPAQRFHDAPLLEIEGWRQRRPLSELVSTNGWRDLTPRP